MTLRSVSNATGAGTTPSVAVPTGVQPGDIVIITMSVDDVAAAVAPGSQPTSFVELGEQTCTADGANTWIGYKRLTAADAGTYSFTAIAAGGSNWVCQAYAFFGRNATNPPVLSTTAVSNTLVNDPTATANGVTALLGDDLLFVVASDANANTAGMSQATPTNFTIALSDQGGFAYVYGAYRNAVAAGATGTVSGVLTTPGTVTTGYVAWLVRIPLADTTTVTFRSITSLTYAAHGTSSTVTAPAGITDNDIIIADVFAGNVSGTVTVTPPAGFTAVASAVTTGLVLGLYGSLQSFWKRASSESGSYVFTHTSASTEATLRAYSGCVTSGSPVDAASTATGTGTTTTATSITTTVANTRLLIAAHNWQGLGATPTSGWNEHYDFILTSLEKNVDNTSAGSTGSVVMTPNGNNVAGDAWSVCLYALKPAIAATAPPPPSTTTFMPFLMR